MTLFGTKTSKSPAKSRGGLWSVIGFVNYAIVDKFSYGT